MNRDPSIKLPDTFADLQPGLVWRHFSTLCAIPRPSKGEARLREHLQAWATARGLSTLVDAVGNLIVRKPASPGRESDPGVALQAHLDMVGQNNADTPHDFTRDAIVPVVRDGWLVAENTTLGADNGIGVALMLAALEDTSLVHGPLEALFTVDEEAGMSGARGLSADILQSPLMLNLDTEEWGEFYLGCAGGLDVNVRRSVDNGAPEPLPAGFTALRIDVSGLRGGHSGVNIHEGRGNAIKILVRLLCQIETRWPLRLGQLQGGSARNALPREAWATIAVPAAASSELVAWLGDCQSVLRNELAGVDEKLRVDCAPCELTHVMAPPEQAIWLASLEAAPHGVRRMSVKVPGVVETSNNFGMVELGADRGHCNFLVRFLVDSAGHALADEIVSLFALSGTAAEKSGYYPGWAPNPGSPLLGVCQAAYRRCFGADAATQVIHAGLECGIIAGKYPGIDIVSFGPTIRSPHAPGEAVDIASVEYCWRLLREILAAPKVGLA